MDGVEIFLIAHVNIHSSLRAHLLYCHCHPIAKPLHCAFEIDFQVGLNFNILLFIINVWAAFLEITIISVIERTVGM